MDPHQASISPQGFWTSTPINVIFWWIGTRSNYSGRQKQLEAVFTTSNKFGAGEKWNSNKSFLNLDSLSTHIRFKVDHFLKTSVDPECGKLELPQWCRCPEISFSFSLHCQQLMLEITQASANDFGPLRRSVSSLYTCLNFEHLCYNDYYTPKCVYLQIHVLCCHFQEVELKGRNTRS